jgi:hypothetical protein
MGGQIALAILSILLVFFILALLAGNYCIQHC